MIESYTQFKYSLVEHLIQMLNENKEMMINIREEVPIIKSPADLDDILHELGWSLDDTDGNGWEPDMWNYYFNEKYEFGLVMQYNGFYWDLKLYRTDIDEDDPE